MKKGLARCKEEFKEIYKSFDRLLETSCNYWWNMDPPLHSRTTKITKTMKSCQFSETEKTKAVPSDVKVMEWSFRDSEVF
jgi:hypothetical protein